MSATLHWLPAVPDFKQAIRSLDGGNEGYSQTANVLINSRLNFSQTRILDERLQSGGGASLRSGLPGKPVRLAILSTCTTTHLHAAIRIGGLRRAIPVEIYEPDYGQYVQELIDGRSGLYEFKPETVLLALDSRFLSAELKISQIGTETSQTIAAIKTSVKELWERIRSGLNCSIIQQTPVPVHTPLLGNNEHRLPGSKAHFLAALSYELRSMADAEGVDLLCVDDRVARDGLDGWHDPVAWHHAKQEVAPVAAPFYGDLVARLLAAKQGRARKCLVLDLDNTIWGGVVGDDGPAGLALGQGSALGESFSAFQSYARQLAERGIILAVCSKNDERNAIQAFEQLPEMILRLQDISCFVANWEPKPDNLRRIAKELNIGLDSLVFVDDNAFERHLVRQELPEVAVPEISEDPSTYAQTIYDAGYFEAVSLTGEDLGRTELYRQNRNRERLATKTDLASYLRDLDMKLVVKPFDETGLQRIVQLINKSNQFNLRTRRYSQEEIVEFMHDPDGGFGLQLRLLDRFGDNGIIAILILRRLDGHALFVDTWLMSCRVLGRQVEEATLNVIAEEARALGYGELVGEYIPSPKNSMVKDHYERLGFTAKEAHAEAQARIESGALRASLSLDAYQPRETSITVCRGAEA